MDRRFYFYANPYQPQSVDAARALLRGLTARGARVFSDPWLADLGIGEKCAPESIPEGTEAMAVFGGDGTLLRAAQYAVCRDLPMLGVHTGTVGFLMPGSPGDTERLAGLLTESRYAVMECPLLQIRYEGGEYLALNDLAFTRGEHPGVMEIRVTADGEEIFTAHGDGVVVSTPLGCTGYGLSAGGPIVRPDAPCLMITPLCARELLLRPVILPLSARIVLLAHGQARRRLQLAVDGQTLLPVTDEARVEITLADQRAKLIQPREHRFFDTLRRKQVDWNFIENRQEKQE